MCDGSKYPPQPEIAKIWQHFAIINEKSIFRFGRVPTFIIMDCPKLSEILIHLSLYTFIDGHISSAILNLLLFVIIYNLLQSHNYLVISSVKVKCVISCNFFKYFSKYHLFLLPAKLVSPF